MWKYSMRYVQSIEVVTVDKEQVFINARNIIWSLFKILLVCLIEPIFSFLPFSGKLTDIHGNFFHYNKEVKHMNSGGVLAALKNHDYYATRVPEAVKQALVP